ncbi:hypothetical protein [Microbacterium sp.]|uniref:hypothetical protein n=1 Tax=Microbacterium sp. TaxID=51671 RepID=UPI002810F82B|nr:hypothetical protein [Microbacterium sp.]
MSSRAEPSSRARARIRAFSAGYTLVALVLIALIAWPLLTSAADGYRPGPGGIVTSDDYYDPWDDPEPTAASAEGDTWTGHGQQYIPLTSLTPGEPLLFTYLDDETPISAVFLSERGAASEDLAPAEFSDYSTEPFHLLPTSSEMTVWLRARTADEWRVRIEPADLEERAGIVSGSGSTSFLYTGTATAARVTARGEYTVRLHITTGEGHDPEYRTFQDSSSTVAWPDSPAVVFSVDSYDDSTSWSIEFFEPAPTASPTPSADASTPEGDADE